MILLTSEEYEKQKKAHPVVSDLVKPATSKPPSISTANDSKQKDQLCGKKRMKEQPEQQQAENNEVGVISYVEKVDYDLLEGILMKNKCKQY